MNEIITILVEQWKYDIGVMSQPWMYYCLLIPIIFYLAFFVMKWMVLTLPIWLPLSILFKAIRGGSVVELRTMFKRVED